jgi:hypothetical protein
MREHHYGEEREQTEQEQAEKMVREGLKRLGWKEADLAARRKGDRGKLKVALRLRAETTEREMDCGAIANGDLDASPVRRRRHTAAP